MRAAAVFGALLAASLAGAAAQGGAAPPPARAADAAAVAATAHRKAARPTTRGTAPRALTVVTLNLWHDQQNWPARRTVMIDTLRALAPDVIFLQEVLQHENLPNQAKALAESLGCGFVFASVDPPDAAKRYGNAILTRHRIVATREAKLAPLDEYRVAVYARIDAGGRPIDAYATHLHHTTEGGAIRAAQVRSLLAFVDSTRGTGALVMGGDFNAAPDAPELAPLRARWTDAYAAVHPEQVGVLVTTLNPAKGHAPCRIDFVYVDPGRLAPEAAEVILDAPAADSVWASDHFGVWVRMGWVR